EALAVEVAAHGARDGVPQTEVLEQGRAAEVEVSVLEPHQLVDVALVLDRERQRARLVEDPELPDLNLDLPGGQPRVFAAGRAAGDDTPHGEHELASHTDRKSTRLNSSHQIISYAVFCLKKKKKKNYQLTQHKHTTTITKR